MKRSQLNRTLISEFSEQGGSYLLDLLDYYAAGWPYLFIGLVELIIISYVYGINNYLADLKHIVGFDPANWLRYPFVFMYSVLSPLLILVILISSWATHESLESGGYLYPGMLSCCF